MRCLSLGFSVVRVGQSLVFCVVFCVVYRWFYSVVRVAQSLVVRVVFVFFILGFIVSFVLPNL